MDMEERKRRVDTEIPITFRSVFPFEAFNDMQTAIFDQTFNSDMSITVAAPTGCGKTVIFELAIIRLLIKYPKMDIKCIYIAPNKALCQQKVVEWTRTFGNLGALVVEITGDTALENTMRLVAKASVIITTPEKWDSLTRSWTDHIFLLGCVDLLLIDEIHHLNEDRGATLETVVVRMRTLNDIYHQRAPAVSKSRNRMRIVALSAVLPNVSDIGQWLHCAPEAIHYFDESYRPVPLAVHTLSYGSMKNPFLFERSLDDKVPEVIRRYSSNKPVVVFCQSKKGAESLSISLCKSLRLNTSSVTTADTSTPLTFEDPKLKSLVRQGFGFHHAGLPADDRSLVEHLYVQGTIQVLCTTSTLAHGVNLPAHLVIIKGTNQWRGGSRGYEKMPKSMILQMIGRAGRPGFDSDGVAVIMTSTEDKAAYTDLNLEVVESSLPGMLVEALCAEISQRVIQDIADGMAWLRNTFFYIRVRQNPGRYGFSQSLSSVELNKQLMALCVSSIEKLSGAGVVSFRADSLTVEPRPEAHHMSRHMVRLETMCVIMKLGGDSSQFNIMTDVCGCSELHRPVRRSDKKLLNDMMKTVRYPLRLRVQEPNHKAYVLLLSAVDKTPISDFSLRVEQAEIVEQCLRVLSALFDHSRERRMGKLLESCILLQRALHVRLWEHIGTTRSIYEQCARISPAVLPRFVENGISSVEDVLQMSAKDLQSVLRCSHEDVSSIIRYSCSLKASQLVATPKMLSKNDLEIIITSASAAAMSHHLQPQVLHNHSEHNHQRRGWSSCYKAQAKDFTSHPFHMICYDSLSYRLLCYRKFTSTSAAMTFTVTLSAGDVQDASHVLVSLICVDKVGLDYRGDNGTDIDMVSNSGGRDLNHSSVTEDNHVVVSVSPSSPTGTGNGGSAGYEYGYGYSDDDDDAPDHHNGTGVQGGAVQQKLKSSYFQAPRSNRTVATTTNVAGGERKVTTRRQHSSSASVTGDCVKKNNDDCAIMDTDNRTGNALKFRGRSRPGGGGGGGGSKKPRKGKGKSDRKKKAVATDPISANTASAASSVHQSRSRSGQGAEFGMFEYKSFRERERSKDEQNRLQLEHHWNEGCGYDEGTYRPPNRQGQFQLQQQSVDGMYAHAMPSGSTRTPPSMSPLVRRGSAGTANRSRDTLGGGRRVDYNSSPAATLLSTDGVAYPGTNVSLDGDMAEHGTTVDTNGINDECGNFAVYEELSRLRRKASEVETTQSYPIKKCRSRLAASAPITAIRGSTGVSGQPAFHGQPQSNHSSQMRTIGNGGTPTLGQAHGTGVVSLPSYAPLDTEVSRYGPYSLGSQAAVSLDHLPSSTNHVPNPSQCDVLQCTGPPRYGSLSGEASLHQYITPDSSSHNRSGGAMGRSFWDVQPLSIMTCARDCEFRNVQTRSQHMYPHQLPIEDDSSSGRRRSENHCTALEISESGGLQNGGRGGIRVSRVAAAPVAADKPYPTLHSDQLLPRQFMRQQDGKIAVAEAVEAEETGVAIGIPMDLSDQHAKVRQGCATKQHPLSAQRPLLTSDNSMRPKAGSLCDTALGSSGNSAVIDLFEQGFL